MKNSLGAAKIRESFGPNSVIDMSRCIYRDNHVDPASCYVMRSEATGSRTLVNFNDLPEMTAQEFVAAVSGLTGQGKTWWHFEVSWTLCHG